jgi:alkylation response protein AidB-like acyl-CoA dehydrogenase
MDVHEAARPGVATNYIARARAIAPLLEAAAPRIDAARALPSDVLDAMHGAGMFRLLVPRSIGGAELDPAIYIQCVEAIAAGDASVAWCMNQGSGCSMSAGYLAPDIAREVFGGERDVLAWGMGPGAKAIRAGGGWRITGTWAFASGSRHATWLGAHCPCFDADGTTPLRYPDGRPWERTMLFRREIATIEDVWQVVGLRGTGSDTYSVQDLFVDDAHTITRDRAEERREPGLIYRFAAMQIYASGFAAVALGIGRATLEAFIALASGKTPALTQASLRDSAVIQSEIGMADGKLNAARTWLIAVLRDAQAATELAGEVPTDHRMKIRQASTYAIHQAKDVVDVAYHEAGSTAIFDANPFERRFRDVNTVTQQVQGRRSHFETIGQHLLGSQPGLRWV